MNKKILVFSYHDENCHHGPSFKTIGEITRQSKEEYCKIHGYDFYLKDKDFDKSWTPRSERINILINNIDNYDWIWYLDADVMIMNQTIKIENLIDDNYDLIIAKTRTEGLIEINDGSMLVKKSKWSKNFLNHIKSVAETSSNPWPCQQAIIDYINITHIEEAKKHIKIVPLRFFNSYYHSWHPNDNYQHGDFTIHLAGRSNQSRFEIFNEAKEHIIKASDYKISFEP
jgi:hypothetical protein